MLKKTAPLRRIAQASNAAVIGETWTRRPVTLPSLVARRFRWNHVIVARKGSGGEVLDAVLDTPLNGS